MTCHTETSGPSFADWEYHRELIISLYSSKGLDEVVHIMRDKHQFVASTRMYKYRLQCWGFRKGRGRRAAASSVVLSYDTDMHGSSIREDDKHILRTQAVVPSTIHRGCNYMISQNYQNDFQDTNLNEQDFSHGYAVPNNVSGFVFRKVTNADPEIGTSGSKHPLHLGNYDRAGFISQLASPSLLAPSLFLRQVDSEMDSVERLTYAIRHMTLEVAESSTTRCSISLQEGCAFWHKIGRSIYTRKVGTYEESLTLIREAEDAAFNDISQFLENPLQSIREMLMTLSVVNTSIQPGLRQHMLGFLARLFEARIGINHGLTIVAYHLSKHPEQPALSDTAMRCMLRNLQTNLGSTHPITFKAETANVRLLRRRGEWNRAHEAGSRLLEFARHLFDADSEETRIAAREYENVLMDQKNWKEALEIGLWTVGQRKPCVDDVSPRHRDKYAIYVMQDIAKCYLNLGCEEMEVAWLRESLRASIIGWGENESVTQHISGKLADAMARRPGCRY